MSIYGGRSGKDLTVTDALNTGYRFLIRPEFSIPILVIGVVVNLAVVAFFAPFVVRLVTGGSGDAFAVVGGFVSAALAAVITAVLGGIILNLYGQVWATMASTGEPPKIGDAFARVGERWMSILGAGVIVGVIELGSLVVLGIIAALLGAFGALLLLVGLVVIAYVAIRLSMSGWLAAEGAAAMDAVRGSWEITNRDMLTIVGWSIVIGLVIFVITWIAGIILGIVPLVGPALTQTLGSAFGFGAGVTLFRRVKGA